MIRPALTTDAPAIAALLNPILRDTTISFTTLEKSHAEIEASIQEHTDNNWPFLVADTGRVQGVASYAPFRKGPGYARTMEHTVYVAADTHKQGIGRALVDALESHAKTRGITTLIGGISGENTTGLAFHRQLGFTQTGHLPAVGHKFGRDLDLILMQKSLVTPASSST